MLIQRFSCVSTVAALCASFAQAAQPSKDADILGTWILTKVLDSADVASLTDKQAAALIGKIVAARRNGIVFNGEPCRVPELRRHREDAAKYVRGGYHAKVGYLGLPDTITVIDLNCTEAFLKSRGKIVVFWDGYFYDAVKQPLKH